MSDTISVITRCGVILCRTRCRTRCQYTISEYTDIGADIAYTISCFTRYRISRHRVIHDIVFYTISCKTRYHLVSRHRVIIWNRDQLYKNRVFGLNLNLVCIGTYQYVLSMYLYEMVHTCCKIQVFHDSSANFKLLGTTYDGHHKSSGTLAMLRHRSFVHDIRIYRYRLRRRSSEKMTTT